MGQKKIILAGETYSSNLGDGVIADTLQFLFEKNSMGFKVVRLDISGRSDFDASPSMIKRSPQFTRPFLGSWQNLIKWYLVRKRRCQKNWQEILQEDDILVIGGGQLLMDNALDFPLKIHHLVQYANSVGVSQIHFSACGVGKGWSLLAQRLLGKSLGQAFSITVRDTLSMEWLKEFDHTLPVTVAGDPAIFAKEVYGEVCQHQSKELFGIGIISPDVVNRYSFMIGEDELVYLWVELIHLLQGKELPVELFTNGSERDFAFAQFVSQVIHKEGLREVSLAKRPKNPQELVRSISKYRAAIAARLHANILAFSYRVPTVGLVWDEKVRSFYAEIGRDDFCISFKNANPEKVMSLLEESMRVGIPSENVEDYKRKALHSIQKIAG